MADQARRILIVEDEGIVAADIQKCLEDAGFEVTGVAASADDAVQETSANRPDLVLMDIRIQGEMDGVEAAELLQRRFGVSTVYLTAHGDKDTIERAKKTHPLGFLLKPFKQTELIHEIEFALERDQAERRLRECQQAALDESQERYRLLLETIPQLVWTTRPDGHCEYLSPQWVEYTGLPEAGQLGLGWLERLHPDDRQRTLEALLRASEAGAPYDLELRLQRRDGAFRWFKARGLPVRGGDGRIARWFGTCTDIEEIRQAEKEIRQLNTQLQNRVEDLRRSEERERARAAELQAVMDAVPVAILLSRDPECRSLMGSRMTYELLGLPYGSNLSPGPQPPAFRILAGGVELAPQQWPLQTAARTCRPVEHAELEVILASGVRRYLFGNAVPLRDEAGRSRGAVAGFLDITERKRMEDRLREAQKAESIGVLAGGVAHDFNNLLTTILGNISLAQMSAPPELMLGLQQISEAAERAAALTRQLLAYAGKGHFDITDFDVAHVLRSSAELIRISIPKNVGFVLDVPFNLPAVTGDSAQIQQVAMNLVINAAEAIGDAQSGTVSIRAGVKHIGPGAEGTDLAPGRYVFLQVRDTGCGMDEPTRARIFDPFFTTKFTGRGLGLAAVQGIVRSHKGGISVESCPGAGSTFTVYLPCVPRRAAVSRRKEGAPAGARAATILVVDDETGVREFAQTALERAGHTVRAAENGLQALEILSGDPGIELVLLDVVMPVLSGGEAFAEIRKRRPGLAVLITSGYNREEARRLGALPADLPVLEKPYTAQRLARAVQRMLDSHCGVLTG